MANQWKEVDKYCKTFTQDTCPSPVCKFVPAGSKNDHKWEDHCGNAATFPKTCDETKRIRGESRRIHGETRKVHGEKK